MIDSHKHLIPGGGNSNTSKERDISIDVIKFFAVLFIINSHADMCYPKYSALATGGAIGDTLFLFCSGYTLFWGSMKRFDNWYKRLVNRFFRYTSKIGYEWYLVHSLTFIVVHHYMDGVMPMWMMLAVCLFASYFIAIGYDSILKIASFK